METAKRNQNLETVQVAFERPRRKANLARRSSIAAGNNYENSNMRDVIYEAIEVLGIFLRGKQASIFTSAPRKIFHYVAN